MRGRVVLLTGLPCSGKTALSRRLAERIGERACVLDGDEVRKTLCADLGFTREDRETNLRRIGFVARAVARTCGTALIAAIAPYASSRTELRAACEADAVRFVEVHLHAPMPVLVKRDVRGRYHNVPGFTGSDAPYEVPASPELRLDTSTLELDVCVAAVEAVL
ncbi:MAG: adenylyl-sulfate kinase [Myxococcaceae bacterium]|nr:adenylyl-sulfate kinase [Myxococcaceae bacterium]